MSHGQISCQTSSPLTCRLEVDIENVDQCDQISESSEYLRNEDVCYYCDEECPVLSLVEIDGVVNCGCIGCPEDTPGARNGLFILAETSETTAPDCEEMMGSYNTETGICNVCDCLGGAVLQVTVTDPTTGDVWCNCNSGPDIEVEEEEEEERSNVQKLITSPTLYGFIFVGAITDYCFL